MLILAILTIVGFTMIAVAIRKAMQYWMSDEVVLSSSAKNAGPLLDSTALTDAERAQIRKRAAEKLRQEISAVKPLGERTFKRQAAGDSSGIDSNELITGDQARAETKKDDHHG
jgi:hypothetical protein